MASLMIFESINGVEFVYQSRRERSQSRLIIRGIPSRKFPALPYRLRGENFRNIPPHQFQTIFDISPFFFPGERTKSAFDPDLLSVRGFFSKFNFLAN